MFRHSMAEQTTLQQTASFASKTERESDKIYDPLTEFMQLLQTVEIDTPEAELNETTMSNNNGERIKF